eukprot:TRINITY_DN9683_c0_g1_i2.p1 TRINITY_DN9683_c0_g1~~TRINITY_DN9683_c0_g1_i2.p1  ORF type:complete len:695 (+),score=121.01 TRINITY_DN9683_c0_g1_i2:177-2261(+)
MVMVGTQVSTKPALHFGVRISICQAPATAYTCFCRFKVPSRKRRKKIVVCKTISNSDISENQLNAATNVLDLQSSPSSDENKGSNVQTLLKRFWKVAIPYWNSEDKFQARLRLAGVFALTLATTGISVGFNFLGRDFYNALASKDQEQFTKQLLYYLGAFAGGIPVFVLRDYGKETLALRWRAWMTKHYLDRYFQNQTYYIIQSKSLIDNPDQRIVDDVSAFTGTSLSFALTLFTSAVDLVSFSNILFGIYPPLFIVLIAYSLGGTAISVLIGKGLVNLNFLQEKKEADLRYGLVRIRENAESIAFYGGERNELELLLQRFKEAFENLTRLLISSRNLEFFTSGYRYLIQILPAAVVAPMYFSGKIEFGVINQSYSAFNHVLGDFSLIVYQFQALSSFSAVIDRLGEFNDTLAQDRSQLVEKFKSRISILLLSQTTLTFPEDKGDDCPSYNAKLLEIEHLTLNTPQQTMQLIRDLSLVVNKGEHLLVMGPSGSGKTSLLRAIAGLWSSGGGTIKLWIQEDTSQFLARNSKIEDMEKVNNEASYKEENQLGLAEQTGKCFTGILFLPQKPYMVLGTLRQQLLYPTWTENSCHNDDSSSSFPFSIQLPHSKDSSSKRIDKPTEEAMVHILEKVSLGHLLTRFNGLDSSVEWSNVLSLGEQQRLAFARLLLARPKLALLDESTSALDEVNEMKIFQR